MQIGAPRWLGFDQINCKSTAFASSPDGEGWMGGAFGFKTRRDETRLSVAFNEWSSKNFEDKLKPLRV